MGIFKHPEPMVPILEPAQQHYSQGGEDVIIANIYKNWLQMARSGFFIDLGAYHPVEKSNTYLLYRQGWRGINIDPAPGCMQVFDEVRPEDINLEIAVSDQRERLLYHMVEGKPESNSCSEDFLIKTGTFDRVSDRIEIQAKALDKVLSKYVPRDKAVDLLNIDVEGMDYKLLSSYDWKSYRPKIVVIELHYEDYVQLMHQDAVRYLLKRGFELAGKTVNAPGVGSLIFVDKILLEEIL